MLKLFEVEGFKNFKDKITFDFSDVRDYKFNTECISNGLLGKAIIYGKNSVGKTNLGLAMFDIVSHLSSKHIDPELYDYYLNANIFPGNDNEAALFHYVFSFDGNEIDYQYTKNDERSLIWESVVINGKLFYDYNYYSKAGNFQGLNELAPTLDLSTLDVDSILKYIVNNTVLPKEHILRRMITFISNMMWYRNSNHNKYIGSKTQNKDYFNFIFTGNNLTEFENLLRSAGVDNDLMAVKDYDGIDRLYFKAQTPLPFFSVASSGTRALYTFFYWYKTEADVSLMFIDEFDALYYYELSETIVKILEKMSNTQVILTSHNTNLLSNRIMRPDCFFIMTERGLTSFANATNRELREGHNLEKLYKSGEFDDGQ